MASHRGQCWDRYSFKIFISDTDSGIKYTLSEFVDGTKLCGTVNTPKGGVPSKEIYAG